MIGKEDYYSEIQSALTTIFLEDMLISTENKLRQENRNARIPYIMP